MTPRVDRVNRLLLIIVGGLLIAAGALALLQGGGVLGATRAHSSVVSDPTARWYGHNGGWFWPVAGVVALVIAVLCVWWVSAQIRTQGSARIELDHSHGGIVTASASALSDCVESDALNQPGIARARARISTVAEETRLHLTIWVEPPYDVTAVVTNLTSAVLPHIANAFEGPDPKPIRTTIHLETAEADVVRLR